MFSKSKWNPSLLCIFLVLLTISLYYNNLFNVDNYYLRYSYNFHKNETKPLSRILNLYKFISNSVTRNTSEKTKPFVILFWTRFYGQIFAMKTDCLEENGIILTSNKEDYYKADAVIFQYNDMQAKTIVFPPKRDHNVPWILAVQESPILLPFPLGESEYDGKLNWTWSTRKNSLFNDDFTNFYKKSERKDENWVYGSAFSSQFLKNKTKLSTWVVSNCRRQMSERQNLVKSLQSGGLSIDIFGKCGQKCEGAYIGDETCFENLGISYKFYFAMENALCEGYITEKIKHGLYHGMIPAVYGMGDVKRYAPPNSFINILDFNTTEDLIKRIKYLDKNPKEYFKYFEWRQNYNLGDGRDYTYIYFCSLFKRVKEYTIKVRNGEERFRHNYKRFDDWYNHFENKGKKCLNCLGSSEVDIKYPVRNRIKLYNDSRRCKD